MKTLVKVLVTLAIVAALGYGGFEYIQKRRQDADNAAKIEAAAESQIAAPAITVAKVQAANFTEVAMISGSIVPREEILVSPEVEGLRVLELLADEGSVVKKGDVLARLVSEQLDAQMAQNDASLARAVAAIAQAKSNIASAEARVKEAKANFERAEPLKKSGYLSTQGYEQRESTMATSEAQLAANQDALAVAVADKAQVEAQRRELAWRRSNAEVKAPAGGIVSRRNARLGGLATGAGEPMFRIIANGDLELDAEVVETDLGLIKEGQKVLIPGPGRAATDTVEGTVRLVSPEIDKTTRLGRVKVFIGANKDLRIGGFARGKIETASSHGLAVPAAAITVEQGTPYVLVLDGTKVKRRTVKTGLFSGDLIEVKDGLQDGDLVVARAAAFVRDGDTVRPMLPDAKISEVKP